MTPPDHPYPEEAVEAAAKALYEWQQGRIVRRPFAKAFPSTKDVYRAEARVAIDAFCDSIGLTVERKPIEYTWDQWPYTRFVTPWKPEREENP